MSWLGKLLGASPETNQQISEATEKLQTVTEFLDKAVDKLENNETLLQAIETSVPWIEDVAEAVGDAIPPVKLLLKLIGLITKETDPRILGLVVFSLAYQAAVADAVEALDKNQVGRIRNFSSLKAKKLKQTLRAKQAAQPEKFENFRLSSALTHPLTLDADNTLEEMMGVLGYPPEVRRLLLEGIHARLTQKFQAIITNGKVKDKFDPLFRLLLIENNDANAFAVVERHMEYQLWRFSKAPVLGKGGPLSLQCTLKDIYVPLDCGILSWEEIRGTGGSSETGSRKNPFDEESGGRVPLLSAVLQLLGDPKFDDAVVIQGIAGAGKSAFTLSLCAELRNLGLRPVRIRMRDLTLDPRMALIDDIINAVIQNSGDTHRSRLWASG